MLFIFFYFDVFPLIKHQNIGYKSLQIPNPLRDTFLQYLVGLQLFFYLYFHFFLANSNPACVAAPDEIPARIPSSLANFNIALDASSSLT